MDAVERPAKKRTKLGGSKPATNEDEQVPLEFAESTVSAPADEPAAGQHTTRDRDANKLLQISFGVAIGSGALGAALGVLPELKWIGLFAPLLVIILFFAFGKLNKFDQRSDTRQQFADSCYFLGFLLTMIAMLAGFLPAGMLDQQLSSQDILRHFSMALGATALGLIFRILALQGARSFHQVSNEIEASLTLYAKRISKEAELIGDHLETVRGDLEKQRERIANAIVQEVTDAVLVAVTPIQNASRDIAISLKRDAETIARLADKVQISLGQSAEQIAQVIELKKTVEESSTDAAEAVSSAVNDLKSAIDSLNGKLTTASGGVATKMDALASALDSALQTVPGMLPAVEGLSGQIGAAQSALSRVQTRTDKLADRIEAAVEKDGRVLSDLDEAKSEILGSIRNAGDETASAIKSAGANFSTQLAGSFETTNESAKQHTEQFAEELQNATKRLAEILQRFAKNIDNASSTR